MKQEQFKSLINECIREVMAEGKVAKKKAALKQIKEIISENELEEADLAELDLKGGIKKAAGAIKQAVGIYNPKDKAAAEKSFDDANAKIGGKETANKSKWLNRAKGYSYKGTFGVKDGKIFFTGTSEMPPTGLGFGANTATKQNENKKRELVKK